MKGRLFLVHSTCVWLNSTIELRYHRRSRVQRFPKEIITNAPQISTRLSKFVPGLVIPFLSQAWIFYLESKQKYYRNSRFFSAGSALLRNQENRGIPFSHQLLYSIQQKMKKILFVKYSGRFTKSNEIIRKAQRVFFNFNVKRRPTK